MTSVPSPSPAAPGLTSAEAARRLAQYGRNVVEEEKPHPWRSFLGKFWAPVPWMLEATVLLQLILGERLEAALIAVLLVFNAVLSFLQEGRSQKAVALLRQRIVVTAHVHRDGAWRDLVAAELVPGDVVHVPLGALVPADLRIIGGNVLVDQSALTGESAGVSAGPGGLVYAGAVVQRGEATGEVAATGARTFFGRTAELVRIARSESREEAEVLGVVRTLAIVTVVLVAVVLAYAHLAGLAVVAILPLILSMLLASIPVALPATFTLTAALGALELARRGILVTRLSAIHEAAAMDVLCTDKTGTLTKNEIAVGALLAFAPHDETELLRLAAMASDEASPDPLDVAVFRAARARGIGLPMAERQRFVPFDPATKRSEGIFATDRGILRAIKGAPPTLAALTGPTAPEFAADAARLAANGARVLAVAAGPEDAPALVGLIAFDDTLREEAPALVADLQRLGVRVLMITGDGVPTAQAVAAACGIPGRVCPAEMLHQEAVPDILGCGVFAGIFPEDKFRIVKLLQRAGHAVGMSGDGVNDAPALKQAEVGIAVANATDVAKAAGSIVLTRPGLADMVAGVEASRRIFQRIVTYTLNTLVKKIELVLFFALALLSTGTIVMTPLLMALLLVTNDFLTMSIATDNVTFSPKPDRWRTRNLMMMAASVAGLRLILSLATLFAGRLILGFDEEHIRTLVFVMLVFSSQATLYLVRERGHAWRSRPSGLLLLSTAVDAAIAITLALGGFLLAPIDAWLIAVVAVCVVAYYAAIDFIKLRLVRAFDLG